MGSEAFDKALAIVLRFEGGLANVAGDKGGPTMAGVTQAVYDEYCDALGIVRQSVEHILPQEVEDVYRRLYWDRMDLQHVDWPLNLVLFDMAVNMGVAKARAAMGAVQFGDGPIEREVYAVLALRLYLYRRTVAADQTQNKFLPGWERRIDVLRREAGL